MRTTTNNDYDFYRELKRAHTIDELRTLIIKRINHLGFSEFSFFPMTIQEVNGHMNVLSTLPEGYWRSYYDKQYFKRDAVLDYFRINQSSTFTSYLYRYICDNPFETESTRINRAIVQDQHCLGIYDQYAMMVTKNHPYLFVISQRNMVSDDFFTRLNDCGNAPFIKQRAPNFYTILSRHRLTLSISRLSHCEHWIH